MPHEVSPSHNNTRLNERYRCAKHLDECAKGLDGSSYLENISPTEVLRILAQELRELP